MTKKTLPDFFKLPLVPKPRKVKRVQMGRKIPFENVVRNLKLGRYNSKIMTADYSNLGLRLFLSQKFAVNLGVSIPFLKKIKLLEEQDVSGWNIVVAPSVNKLMSKKKAIAQEVKTSERKWREWKRRMKIG